MGKIVAFVPMRSGSKEIKNKNIKFICGQPLCYWALSALQKSKVDKIVVAIDSEDYKKIVKNFGFNKIYFYNRDPENAQDTSTTESVLIEYFKNHDSNFDDFILVQVTNPFIQERDVNNLIRIYKENGYNSVLSVADLTGRFIWQDETYNKNSRAINYNYMDRPLRQEIKESLYMENGAMYINSILNLLKCENRLTDPIGLYKMPQYTLHEIDSEWDWLLIEKILGITNYDE